MTVKKILPPQLREIPPSSKLVWLYIDRYPGKHSARSLEAALGIVGATVISDLVEAGLLIELQPASGPRLGEYRTATPEEMAKSKPFVIHARRKKAL